MANPWFKLYGLEYLADPKIQRLSPAERSCWITLLCLASMDDGVVKNISEEFLMERSGLDPLEDEWNSTQGVLVKFELLGFIRVEGKDVHIKNWQKRQQVYSESRDRVQRWREKQRLNTPVTPVTLQRNGKSRIDKNRIETSNEVTLPDPKVKAIKEELTAKFPTKR